MKVLNKSNIIELTKRSGVISSVLSWLWLIAGYVLDIWYQLVPGEWIIDSDLAAEMVLANMLNNERNIISPNWFYSTELRVFNLQWFYRIGLLVFPNNWTYARAFAMAIFLIVVAAAWMFLMNACKLGKYGVWAAAFAIWPFGFRHHFLSTYGGYYFVFHIFSLAILGIIALLGSREYTKSKKILLILAGCALSFGSGLNGARQTMAFFVPVCIMAVTMVFIDIRKESITNWEELKSKKSEKLKYLTYSYLFAAANVIGYYINTHILYRIYTFQIQNEIEWQVNHDTEIPDVFIDFIQLFGFREAVDVFSFDGIASALGFAVGIFIIYSMIRLIKNYSLLNQCEQMILVMSIMSIIVMGMIFCYMDHQYLDKYWLPVMPFGIILICLELKTDEFNYSGLKSALTVIVSICITICSISTVKLAIENPFYGKEGLYEVAMWLEENDYDKGIAEFWYSQCITEMTNGNIEMWTIRNAEDTKFYHWLQDKSHINPPTGKTFLLLAAPADETMENTNVLQGNGTLVYDDGAYSVYEMDDVSFMGE